MPNKMPERISRRRSVATQEGTGAYHPIWCVLFTHQKLVRFSWKRTGRLLLLLCLQLVLSVGTSGSLDGLHESESGFLDGGDGGLLVGHELLVGLLELLDFSLEGGLGVLHFGLLLGDGGIEVGGGHGLELLDLGLLVVVAEVDVGRRAHWLEVLVGELLQVIVRTSSLVVLKGGGISPLDGWVSTDTIGFAKWLALGSAVHISDELGRATGEIFGELVPIWLHLLTVPSPRGEELDEHRLSGSFGVPIVWCEFDGVGAGHKAEQDQSEILHGCCVDDFNFLCQQCGAMQRCPVFGHFILVVCPSVQYRHFQYKLVLVFTYARLSTRLNGGTISVPAKLKQRGTSVVVSHRCRASTHWSACNLIQFVLAVHLMKETI
mmetsp:Transcript_18269/g.52137  ORF Transcript_18269/g.52137 Transcript_18269/m.52137 type:complete len:377 (-) Transcript_18269:158-1288(-)